MLPFRDENPTRNFPLVTIALIVVNTLVFAYMFSLLAEGEQAFRTFIMRAAVIPASLVGRTEIPAQIDPEWVTVFTAMFMHGGWLHLGGNMLYLWIFGNNIEDIMGSGRFLIFYLLTGVIATFTHVASALGSPSAEIPSLGASGAVAGVLGAYLVRFPGAQVQTCVFFIFITIIRLPAILVLGFWFVIQLLSGVASLVPGAVAGGTAYWAHIGGFIAGMLLVSLFAKRTRNRYNEYYPG
jgi:membrane associated rhomboid family serine protease